ncbi:hypothetical protein NBRC10512_007817 [Rhodotorula toruloides]|uniref:Checkpoint protein n=2 Tax=Rhodotorula toruloides TaxID=5286 RepID=A0A061AFA9_RHOTO|nr:HUS1 checkpoint protein [Rhodotorula toruloides NP11]EMS19699.1 HUS1 checkpoint protein [Rhodotorula toruloides NP11]CDR36276.1 RHTO0S01e18096g1_1 [Rhodotorula toruloides]
MRFRAEISNPSQFARLISSLSPLGKSATLKLTEETTHLICMPTGTKSDVQVWSQIANDSIFNTSTMRVESNNNNEIYLQLSLDHLAKALRSASGATQVTAKLAKRGGNQGKGDGAYPVLSLVIESSSRLGKRLEITQDVAVKVLKTDDLKELKEPLCPQPEVIVILPALQKLRTVTERLKTISSHVTISANNLGELRLRAEADEAKVETEWRGLKRPNGESMTAEVDDPAEFFSVTLDTKNLLRFLNTYAVATTTIACFCSNHCAIFYVYVGESKDKVQGGVLTFYVPAVKIDGDDED